MGYGDCRYLIKIDCDKNLSKIINDNLYGDGMVSHLYFANIDKKNTAHLYYFDCPWWYHVYNWNFLLFKTTKKILPFYLAHFHYPSKYLPLVSHSVFYLKRKTYIVKYRSFFLKHSSNIIICSINKEYHQ